MGVVLVVTVTQTCYWHFIHRAHNHHAIVWGSPVHGKLSFQKVSMEDPKMNKTWLFLQGILKCHKNVIIEREKKNKVYGLFYGLLTLGFCVWWIAKEDSFHDIIQKC